MPLNDSTPSRRDDAVCLRDILRGIRAAKSDARDFALFDARDALHGLGVDHAEIDGFDAHDDDALDHHIGQAHAVATALGAPDDTDHSALFGEVGQETLAGDAGEDRLGAPRKPLMLPEDRLLGSLPENRLYRPLFISPEDADPNNPMDRMQVVNVANVSDEEMGMVDKAIRYLNRSPTARAAIDAGLARGVKINLTDDADHQFDPTTRIVQWDPRSQINIIGPDLNPTDKTQSAAFGLGHEFEHIWSPHGWPKERKEGRVRLDYERPAGRELREPMQNGETPRLYRTDDPTSRVLGTFDAFNTKHWNAKHWRD